ncbi:Ribonuclease HII [Candidatus Entotheonellaceae bacterium PAL068K]
MVRQVASDGPFLPVEAEAQAAGYPRVVGLDEAGRGPLAGPVVAAAVLLPAQADIDGLRDSKRLTVRQRDAVYAWLRACGVAYGIGMVAAAQIDRHDIVWATKTAMLRAVQQLGPTPDLLLIDGTAALPLTIAQQTLVRGDSLCASIAAASVLAKVTRDRLMLSYAQRYPVYEFERHKGYPTRDHYTRLRRYGPCPIHRRSFRGVVEASSSDSGERS